MQQTLKKNICIIASSLGGGGAERVASQQTKMLQDIGFNVFVITIFNSITYPVTGTLLNLGVQINEKESTKAKIKRHFKIKKFLYNNNVDVIIDHRIKSSVINELIYSYFTYFGKSVVYYVHSYLIENYIPGNNIFFKRVFGRAKKIITVSKEIELKVKNTFGFKNIKTIYNPIESSIINDSHDNGIMPNYKYVLFYGRLVDEVKNLKLLIHAYQKSILVKKNIKLLIIGDGKDKVMLIDLVKNLNLSEMILFKPFASSPFSFVKQAKYTLLTSKYEGFPMTIIESLACGTPVISVNCQSGPNEIISNEFNGLLVENYNKEALVRAMDSFILNSDLYKKCKLNTKGSISQFTMDVIEKQWYNLLK